MRIKFMNTEIDNVTIDEALDAIDNLIKDGKPSYVVTPNVDHIVQLETDEEFREVYKNADLILTDGKPLIWISKKYKTPIKEKISGSDLFPKLCAMAAEKNYSMFFLGAKEGVAAKAAENLTLKFHGLNVVGTYSPSFGFENNADELEKIFSMIRQTTPHILIVGLGAPKQEKFIAKYLTNLNVPVSLGLGASLDFEAGTVKRAPKWMSDHGFEWLYRVLKEPKRLFKRYWRDMKMIRPLIKKYNPKNVKSSKKNNENID